MKERTVVHKNKEPDSKQSCASKKRPERVKLLLRKSRKIYPENSWHKAKRPENSSESEKLDRYLIVKRRPIEKNKQTEEFMKITTIIIREILLLSIFASYHQNTNKERSNEMPMK